MQKIGYLTLVVVDMDLIDIHQHIDFCSNETEIMAPIKYVLHHCIRKATGHDSVTQFQSFEGDAKSFTQLGSVKIV